MNLDRKIRELNHKRIDFFRFLKLKITYYFCLSFSKLFIFNNKTNSKLKTFVVLRLDDKLGDSVTSTGFLQALKTDSADNKVVVVAGPGTVSMYKTLSFVDEVIVSKKGFINSLKTFFELKKINSINFIVNTSHILNPRSIFLVLTAKAENKVGYFDPKYLIFSKAANIDFLKDHITDRYRKLLQVLNIKYFSNVDLSYHVKIEDAALIRVQQKMASIKKGSKPVLAINCFAGGRLRNLNEATVKAILLNTSELFGAVIFLANRGDHKLLNSWKISELQNCYHFPELSTLHDNLAFALNADLVLTPDTSWVHLACALKKKLVAIYREDRNSEEANSIIWAPYGTRYERVFARFKDGEIEDINCVRIDEVVTAIKRLLE